MFRVGQKVVCIESPKGILTNGLRKGLINPVNPIKGEICLIYRINEGHLMLEEYKRNIFGNLSAYNPKYFKPLELDYKFVEEIIKQVQPIKQEA